MQAMIFAAGIGKRLGEITTVQPKALVEINGKSLLRIAVEKLTSEGFEDIIINIHHFAERVENEIIELRKEGYCLSISDERDLLLETGGGLYKARSFFRSEPFLLYNADIITDIDLSSFYCHHIRQRGIATLAVAERGNDRVFLINPGGVVCGWQNRKTGERVISREETGPLTEISFSGIHVADPAIFGFMSQGIYSMTSLYLKIAGSQIINTVRHDEDFWADIGTPEELERVRKFLADR